MALKYNTFGWQRLENEVNKTLLKKPEKDINLNNQENLKKNSPRP